MNIVMCTPCLFGLESVLSQEIKRIGGKNIAAYDGKVTFSGDFSLLTKANIYLRCAERVCVVLGSFKAESFTELFDQVVQIPFEQYIGKLDAFPVKGWSRSSKLHSIPDCQSIIKRAIVRRFERVYGQSWFEETGILLQIRFSIFKDIVTIMLDSSGASLHKRGYRRNSNLAPIKETLAAGIASFARVRSDSVVCDPMCGSGTLLIEAALAAYRIAPGVRRTFAAENWACIPEKFWKESREEALAEIDRQSSFLGYGCDIDPNAAALTAENAMKAGVGKKISTETRALAEFDKFAGTHDKAIILCNPPYGERMLELQQAEDIYRLMGKLFVRRPGYSYYIISPHEQFESLFGRKADKRRKLYNGMIKCQLYMYYNG